MTPRSVKVRVPATVGNFGGVRARTVALDGCLNVKVTLRLDGHVNVRYFGENGERVPRDRSNLIVRAVESALGSKELEFTGADVVIYSSVPVGVGLGSSAAAVLAGLIAADRLFDLGFNENEIFELAAVHESRLDNVRAAWLGGRFLSTGDGEASQTASASLPEHFVLDVVIPDFERLDMPFASAHDKDVPGLGDALNVHFPGVSVFRCGFGPAVGILDSELRPETVKAVQGCFARHGVASRSILFRLSPTGARDWNAASGEVSSVSMDGNEPVRRPTLIPV